MKPSPAQLTDLILEIFRTNGRLLAAGDDLVADLGLTSARWQVLGAIALAPERLPVAQIARDMGLTRQAVQRIANDLEAAGLLRFEENPRHQRAQLVLLTPAGRKAFDAAMARQLPWAKNLGATLKADEVETALTVLRTIRERATVEVALKPVRQRTKSGV
ncbi:MarR family winged helix-turn-helix transcriptional regulator [Pseudorhodoplanes sinuspersici]|uniref:MarR family transcriptional regulator n=1 Tax=Pseudorhodoplanes sinuspersici TaxID=1235591 RepID=A0A1W6ZL99_9HYPH|nr:helix-turn-helix domain-containing protein [Pseudorhodoplanes sinuspersici]ARP98129.1 MarR family transcriptional regulator [Pseudorhodoplanes sinuspersici]RKE68118.1 DNA-binding MarR family transcriptional regulator [Pseudorhodoplanes sinuspersici]